MNKSGTSTILLNGNYDSAQSYGMHALVSTHLAIVFPASACLTISAFSSYGRLFRRLSSTSEVCRLNMKLEYDNQQKPLIITWMWLDLELSA